MTLRKPLIIAFLFLFGLIPLTSFSQCRGTLVWNDEFTGTTLDMTKWNFETGNGCPSLCGWGNNELEYYTNTTSNTRVTGGNLVIEAKPEVISGSSFSSGKILSRNIAYWTYGRFEARMRLPLGRGLWPAFWMLPEVNNWPGTGEIDIMEYRGDYPTRTSGTLHYGNPWPQNQWDGTDLFQPINLTTSFNVYAVEWDANEIRWYLNDRVIKIVTRTPNSLNPVNNNTGNQWPWTTNFHLILNLAVGGWFPATTNAADVVLTKPTFEIDYVRVYNMTPAIGTQTPYNGTPAPIPGKIEAEEFDLGCDQAAYFDTDLPNSGGALRGERVDIEACADVGGGYDVGWTEAGEWMEYTVNVAANATYDMAFRIASQPGGGSLRVELDGTNITGTVNINSTGAWTNWQTVNLTNRAMSAGTHILRLYVISSGFNINYVNITTNTLLPITLLDFTGEQKEGAVLLNWSTAQEINNDYFTLEKSSDGNDWQVLGTVKAGNSPERVQEYSFEDLTPLISKTYYRLKQTDLDGKFSHSEIISLNSFSQNIQLAPNPFTEETNVLVSENTNELYLLDITGNLLQTINTKEEKKITLGQNLPKGIYLLKVPNGKTEKLVKQ